jgi:hypothetical protein
VKFWGILMQVSEKLENAESQGNVREISILVLHNNKDNKMPQIRSDKSEDCK